MGLIKFYINYLWQKVTLGYDRMPMEIEARYEEDEYARENYSEVYFNPDKK